jgi:hypothetical protein
VKTGDKGNLTTEITERTPKEISVNSVFSVVALVYHRNSRRPVIKPLKHPSCHCEEHSDAAISP